MSSKPTSFTFSPASAPQISSARIQTCPLLQRVANHWGNNPAHWFPNGTTNNNDISKFPNAYKQLLAELAEKSGSAGRVTALNLMAESAKRGRPRGNQAHRIHPADIKHAITHFTPDSNQPESAAPFVHRGIRRPRSPSTDTSSDSDDDEPAPQRRRLEQATTTGAAAIPSKSAGPQTEMDERSLLALKDLVISGHEDKLKKLQEENDRLAAENARLQAESIQVTKLAGTFCSAWQIASMVNGKQRDGASPPPPLKGEDIDGALAAFEGVKDKLAPFLPQGFRTVDGMGAQFDRLVADAMEFEDDEGDCDDMVDDAEEEEGEVWGYASDPEDEDMEDDNDGGNGGFPLRLFRDELARAKKGTEKQWVVDEDEDEEAEEMDDE
ncbi:hypothetical protein DIS24_g10970 [Lasiodiplodia hormozganensis]|uniref:Uncharacterized protein n=1 Tax=Lasiodiplodia hormozganensis TaxID=869390 RepID=A0AA39X2N1_9PEZI|nr:hypothetical protein DIS24_g10970 [Lasiodiplodia hormozganensis]